MTTPKSTKAARNARRLMSALYLNGVAIAVVAIGIIPIAMDEARNSETAWSWNPLSWLNADDFDHLKVLFFTCAVSLGLHFYARILVAKMED